MTSLEDLLRDTLAERAHDVDSLALAATPPPRRTGRRWVAVGTVVAVAAAILVGVVLVAPWRGTPHRDATPADVTTDPPAGMQWVSFHGITLTVPTTWAVGSFACSTPSTPGVVVIGTSPLQCLLRPRVGQALVRLNALGTTPPKGTATTVGGHPAYQATSSGAGPDQATSLQLPDAGVAMDVTLPVGGTTSMKEILDAVEYTPVDHHGCAAQQRYLTDTLGARASTFDLRDMVSGTVCEYEDAGVGDRDAPPGLLGSRTLSNSDLVRLATIVGAAQPVLPTDVVSDGSADTAGEHLYRLRGRDGQGLTLWADAVPGGPLVLHDDQDRFAEITGAMPDLPGAYS